MIDPGQFRRLIVAPTLTALGMHSFAAENLVVGTALAESGLRWLAQKGGPAVGVYQIEPATLRDLVRYARERQPFVGLKIARLIKYDWQGLDDDALAERAMSDLVLATALCRLRYYMVAEPLPDAGDLAALGAYWVKNYNAGGKGTVDHFVDAYRAARDLVSSGPMQQGAA